MSDKYTVEIITPEETILKSETVKLPFLHLRDKWILKDHIPLITFLRPGLIVIKNTDKKKYYVEDGTVEFSNNSLLILTSTIKDLKDFDNKSITNLLENAKNI